MAFDFDHAVTAPFRMQPGLRRLAAGSPQFTPNRPGARHLQAKLAVLAQDPWSALMKVDRFDARPALQVALAQLAAEHPDAAALTPQGGLQARWLGCTAEWDGTLHATGDGARWLAGLQALPPDWRLPALLSLAIEEDLALVDGQRATLPWLAVCLPSHWAPADKLGRHFAEVHAPVADNRVLVAAGEHLLRLVCGPERWERFVWNVTMQPALDQHPARRASAQARGEAPTGWPEPAVADAEALGALAQFRTERQTFMPVPEGQQAVFTIQVDVQPLADAIDTPARAAALQAALATMSPEVLAYRSLAPARERLLAWLAARAATA